MPSEMVTGSYSSVRGLLSPDAADRLDGWRQRTLEGNEGVIRSYLYENLTYSQLVDKFDYLYDQDITYFSDLEKEEARGVGPNSVRLPWAEREPISIPPFYAPRDFKPEIRAYGKALNWARSLLPARSLKPLPIEVSFSRLPKNKQSGLPEYSSNHSVLESYLKRARRVVQGDASERFLWPAVAGWRGQAGGPEPKDVKQRLVWMYDKVDTILGLRYLHPVLDALRSHPTFSAWNDLDVVDVTISSMLRLAKRDNLTIFSTDYSGFDASIPGELLRDCMDIVKSWFPREEEHVLDFLIENLLTLGILTPSGVTPVRDGGMPSGTSMTNLLDSLVNIVASRYAAEKLGIKHVGSTVLGDDAVNIYQPSPDLNLIVEAISDLNLEQNQAKQHVAPDSVHYLQRAYSLEYVVEGVNRGVRSLMRTIGGMVGYERSRQGVGLPFAVSRNIMQLENAKWNPLFQKAAEQVFRENPVTLSRTPMAWFRSAGGVDEVSSLLGIDSFRYTSETGVRKFKTVELMNQLRR